MMCSICDGEIRTGVEAANRDGVPPELVISYLGHVVVVDELCVEHSEAVLDLLTRLGIDSGDTGKTLPMFAGGGG